MGFTLRSINQLFSNAKGLTHDMIAAELKVPKPTILLWFNEPTNYTLDVISKLESLFQQPILNTNPVQYGITSGYRDYFKTNADSETSNSQITDTIEQLTNALKDESYRQGWVSNIAMVQLDNE